MPRILRAFVAIAALLVTAGTAQAEVAPLPAPIAEDSLEPLAIPALEAFDVGTTPTGLPPEPGLGSGGAVATDATKLSPAVASDSPAPEGMDYAAAPASPYAAAETGWTDDLIALEVAFQVANALDAVTTDRCLRRTTCQEVNPLFGKRPSSGVIYGAKAAAGLIHYFAIDMLARSSPGTARTVAWISTIFQTGIVGINLSRSF